MVPLWLYGFFAFPYFFSFLTYLGLFSNCMLISTTSKKEDRVKENIVLKGNLHSQREMKFLVLITFDRENANLTVYLSRIAIFSSIHKEMFFETGNCMSEVQYLDK